MSGAEPPPPVPSAPPTLPSYTSVSWPPLHYDLYEKVYKLIIEKALFFNTAESRQQSPYNFKTPEELRQEIDFTLGDKGVGSEKLIQYLEKLVAYSPHRSHPFHLSKDGNGLDPYGIAGDFMGNILSTAVITYLFAPVFTLQEIEVEYNLRKILGYPNPKTGDGIQVPGGGFATSMVIAAALNYKYPSIKDNGFRGSDKPHLAVYASEQCNDYVEKACIVAGLGSDSFFKVRTDQYGRMNVAQLRQKIQRNQSNGVEPFMVIATVGSNPFGAIDPIGDIAQVCQEYGNVWLHIDGNYAGPLILSDEYRASKLGGIEKSQSFAMGNEGMLGTPFATTIMVTPYTDQFFTTFGVGSQYVFEPTLLYDSKFDNGDHTIQTSRRPDIAKLWLIWKRKGRNGIAMHLKYTMELAAQFHAEIGRRSSFYSMQSQIDTNRVVFYYVPSRFRFIPRRYDYLSSQMATTSRNIKKLLLSRGTAFLSLTNVPRYPESFVVSISNSAITLDDLKYVLNEIEEAGREVGRSKSERSGEGNADIQAQRSPHDEVNFAIPPPPQDQYPSYVNTPIPTLHGGLFQKIFKQFDAIGLYYQDKRKEPPLTFVTPDVLKRELDMRLSDQPTLANDDEVITALSKMIKYSIHQAHPFYIYQLLSGGLDPYSIMADFVATVMTSNCLTYEDAPFYTLMEEELVKASRRRLGFPEEGDGMVMPGGSIGVISAIVVARLALFPDTKTRGLEEWRDMKLTIYVNRNAHYCFRKGALLQGFGLNNVIEVAPDQDGRMNLDELRNAVAKTKSEGGTPFFVGATAGTTILGVFDNITEISKVCKENNMWLHTDASVGGSVMFSDTQLKAKLANQPLADSFNFNPHKWMGTAIECSILMFKQNGIVKQTLGISPRSVSRRKHGLFGWFGKPRTPRPQQDQTRDYDSTSAFGDLAAHGGIGWERRANILKFWFMWKAKGVEGMGKHIDYTMENKDWLVSELKRPERREMFRLVKPDFECAGVCFYYLPLALRSMSENSEEYKQALSKVPLPLQARLVRAGVTIPPVFTDDGSPLFTKFTILSSGVNTDDMRYLLDAMDYYGKDLPVD